MKLLIDEVDVRKLHNTLVTSKICKENVCEFTECPLHEFCSLFSHIIDDAERVKK